MHRVEAGRWNWILQAASGLLLVALVGLHWIAQHYVAAGGLRTHAEVVAYLRRAPILALEVTFLISVTAHALLGVRAILLDLGLSQRAARWTNWGLLLIGAGTIGYGIDLALTIIRQG